MTGRIIAVALTSVLLLGACAAPPVRRAPSRENLAERAALTARLVAIQEQHLAYVRTQYDNGVASQGDVTAAEIAFIDAKLRHLSAQALIEMSD